jgi:hypothetical protein
MSTAKHHNEWLSLLDISGPFLSLPVLMRVYPQGLEAHDAEGSREARLAYEEWLDDQQGLRPDPAMHTLWVRYVFERLLELSDETIAEGVAVASTLRVTFAEHGEMLSPDLVIHEPKNPAKPRMLVQVYPIGQNLEKTVAEKRWKASPAMRMMELLRATGIRLGLVTNGEQWMLVDAPRGETTGFISWYASLWFEEQLTLRSFRSLLSARRFFSVTDKETLEGMLADSVNEQQEVTDQLGYQVRRAVEVLIRSIDKADQERGRTLLQGIKESELYEAALTVMMRLVFLFSAEERGLLLLGDPLYDQHYAVSTLRAQLREIADQHGEEVLERRFDAWCRLLATFRAVYGGIQHDRLRLPAYGGSLFDPERFPFLAGRSRDVPMSDDDHPLPISNRTVLHLLEALQILRMPVPGGGKEPRRLSFRSLDVEQIGHVYEGLLDHTAVRADEIVLGLAGSRDKEPEVGLSSLIAEQAKGQERFAAWLAENTGRTENAVRKSLSAASDSFQIQRLKSACGNDARVFDQVSPFAGLIRADDFETPMVILQGNVYVTAGVTRRATGTHYTPRSLTEPVVQHTLEPLVYFGVAEGLPREEWKLRSAAEILAIKVCDMAMGSAGFLVQADRYLAERLMEAWAIASEGGIQITPDGMPSKGLPGETLLPKDEDERVILARRLVADRCLYGVDKNPLAVEIAKLSLWLTTMAKGRPFSFLDHALRCGDALVGASADDFLRWAHGYQNSAMTLFDEQLRLQLQTARQKRRELEAFEVKDVRDSELKAALLKEADTAMAHVKRGCDLLTGARLLGLSDREIEGLQLSLLFPYMTGELDGVVETGKHPDATRSLNIAKKERVFHWEFEFPEVFQHGGFSAFVGNPPYIGGQKISGLFGDSYRSYIVTNVGNDVRGSADICGYFLLRSWALSAKSSVQGFIATSSIAEGDTKDVTLEPIINAGGVIVRASSRQNWPGSASATYIPIFIRKGGWNGACVLNESNVNRISPSLTDENIPTDKPKKLKANSEISYQGAVPLGQGFVLSQKEKEELIQKNPKNADVIWPYITGREVNLYFDHHADDWIINFHDWPLDRDSNTNYDGPVASDYPDCLEIVRLKVKPQRDKVNRKIRRERWWQYGELAKGLYQAIEKYKKVFAIAQQATKYIEFGTLPVGTVFSNAIAVIASDNFGLFGLLTSSFHKAWARNYGSYNLELIRYAPSDLLETFPFPKNLEVLGQIGEAYHEHRRQIMLARKEGLTSTYNRFHNPKESAEDIVRLRELHVEMDRAVASAYGWGSAVYSDQLSVTSEKPLDLGHGFHETAQGVRFTISESARREVLSRLLGLNHERYEEEVKAGLHEKKGKKKGGKKGKRSSKVGEEPGQYGMF